MKYLKKFNEDYDTAMVDKNEIYLNPAMKLFNNLFNKLGLSATKQNLMQNGSDHLACRIQINLVLKENNSISGKPVKTYFNKFIRILHKKSTDVYMIKKNNRPSVVGYYIAYTDDKQFNQNVRDNVDVVVITDNHLGIPIDKVEYIFNDLITKFLAFMQKIGNFVNFHINSTSVGKNVELPLFKDIIIQYLSFIQKSKCTSEPPELIKIIYDNISNSSQCFKLLNGLKKDPLYKKFKMIGDPDKITLGTDLGELGF